MSARSYLVYRLTAALGSMGTLAGNERRGSDDWPARSAVTGMLGAALGVRRTDRSGFASLESDYAIGLSRLQLGPILTDFHTAQTVPTSAAKRPSSRSDALALGKAKGSLGTVTVITHREYHQECMFDVAVLAIAEEPQWSLDVIRDALLRPHFTLYFGRKACPLDLPLGPRILDADDSIKAFDFYRRSIPTPSSATSGEFLLDARLVDENCDQGQAIVRRDGVVDRERWTFADREYLLLNVSPEDVS